jgi:hypothetical protein
LEAFQAVAKHGVLCPIDWKPNNNAADTISTISNTLTESYEDRLANLQKEFGVQVTDLDAKHKTSSKEEDSSPNTDKTTSDETVSSEDKAASIRSTHSQSSSIPLAVQELPVEHDRPQILRPDSSFRQDCLPRSLSLTNLTPPPPYSSHTIRSCSAPPTAHVTLTHAQLPRWCWADVERTRQEQESQCHSHTQWLFCAADAVASDV